jgi:hypothetical protein
MKRDSCGMPEVTFAESCRQGEYDPEKGDNLQLGEVVFSCHLWPCTFGMQ